MWQPGWEGVWGRMDTCICMAEYLCRPPETITALLIGCTPIQNKEDLKKKTFHGKESFFIYFPLVAQTVKHLVYNVGDMGSIPGSGRSSGEGNGNLLQYYCLENPTDRGAW